MFTCKYCNKNFTRKDSLKRHIEENRCKIIKNNIIEDNIDSILINKDNELNECKYCMKKFKKKKYLDKNIKLYCQNY